MSTTYYGTLDSTPVNLTVQPGQAFPTDRQGTLVEIDALPAGATVDKIFYFSSPTSGKYLKRVINGKMRAAELGIYPSNTGAVNSTILNAAFSNAGINEIVFDYGSNVDVEIVFNGTIDGMGKKMTIRKGTILDAGSAATLLTNITIEAPNDLRIFGDSIKTDYIKTVNGEVSVAWWGPAGDGTAPDHTKINKALSVGSCPVVNFKSPVPGKVYYIETALTVPANKILRFGNNDRLKWNNNTLVNFEGKVEADYNAYIFESTGGRFKTGVSSNDEWSVKWFGAKGDEDNVTDDTQALKNAEAAASNRITSNETISTLYFPKGTYRADNVAYRTNIRGAGESSRLMAYTAGAYAVILDAADGYPVGSPAWDFKHIKDLTIVGDSSQLRNGITFGSKEGINPQNAGRWVIENVGFQNLNICIHKQFGNIGNRYLSCSFGVSNYHYYAVQNVSPVMHTGNDYFDHCHFRSSFKSCVYINQDMNGGGHHFNNCIFEGNQGFAVFIKAYGNALFPFVLENVYIEANALAATVNIDGTDYTPRDWYLNSTRTAYFKHTAIGKFTALNNSTVHLENCNEYISGASIAKDSSTAVFIDKGFGFNTGNLNTLHLTPTIADPRQASRFKYSLPVNVVRRDPAICKFSDSFSKAVSQSYMDVGLSLVNDGFLYEQCWEMAPAESAGYSVNYRPESLFDITAEKYYVIGYGIKIMAGSGDSQAGGAVARFVNQGSGSLQPSAPAGQWGYVYTIDKATAAGSTYLQFYRAPGLTYRIACLQYLEFDRYEDAYAFVYRNVFMCNDPSDRIHLPLTDTDTSYSIGGATLVQNLIIRPAVALTGFKIGTTAGGSEILPAQAIPNKSTVINIPLIFDSTTTLYFSGITSSTQITLVKK